MWQMLQAAWAGMRLHCPACGQGRVYRGLTTMNETCSHCGVAFEREEGDWVGAIVVAYSITSVLVAAGISLTVALTSLPPEVHVTLWSGFTVVFLLLTYRNMKGIWLGILHVMTGLKKE